MRVKAILLKSLFDKDKVLGDGMKITGLKARKPLRQDSGFFNAGFYFRKRFSIFLSESRSFVIKCGDEYLHQETYYNCAARRDW